MKKSWLFAIIICLASITTGLFAQEQQSGENRKERFEKFKVEREAFISQAMKLTDSEKAVFLPLCNELQLKKFELNKTLRDETRKIYNAQKEGQSLTEADYKKVIALGNRTKVQEAQLDQEYTEKFLQVIPAEKVFLYQQAEQQFGKNMIERRGQSDFGRKNGDAPQLRMKKSDKDGKKD